MYDSAGVIMIGAILSVCFIPHSLIAPTIYKEFLKNSLGGVQVDPYHQISPGPERSTHVPERLNGYLKTLPTTVTPTKNYGYV